MSNPGLSEEQAREAVEALHKAGGVKEYAARALGLPANTYKSRLKRAFEMGVHLSEGAREAMDGAKLSGVEINGGYRHRYDDEGKKVETVRWSVPKQELALETVLDKVRAAFDGMEAAAFVPPPEYTLADLCTTYGIADAHLGLMSWARETGSDYDTNIAANRVSDWVAQCVASSPASHTGIIMDVGDFTHADNDTYQTPRSKHVLDVDTRMFRTLDVGIATLSSAVESALTKHQEVHVVILPGNHDSTIYLAIMFALAERYRDNPRVIVHKKPGEFFVYEFGRVMIACHHGDKAKADRLVHFVADEFSEIWGRTRHRFLYTGHLHHHKSQDIGGMKWEQLRAVAERDAYAVSHAYAARAQLSAVTYHRERGEVQRVSVNA